MHLISKKLVEKFDVYDITVDEDECFELSNGVIAHNSMFAKTVLSGGKGAYYSASNIYFISRSQEKSGTDIVGYNFNITVEKSRTVKEKSKLPLSVMYDSGINKFSGLLDLALELKAVVKPSNGWYSKVDLATGEIEDKKYRASDTNSDDFWNSILNSSEFKELVKSRFKLGYSTKNTETQDGQNSVI